MVVGVSDNSVTIIKYKLNGEYLIKGFDKQFEPDEPTRLDRVVEWSADMEMKHGEDYEELWIKTCPIFATKG